MSRGSRDATALLLRSGLSKAWIVGSPNKDSYIHSLDDFPFRTPPISWPVPMGAYIESPQLNAQEDLARTRRVLGEMAR